MQAAAEASFCKSEYKPATPSFLKDGNREVRQVWRASVLEALPPGMVTPSEISCSTILFEKSQAPSGWHQVYKPQRKSLEQCTYRIHTKDFGQLSDAEGLDMSKVRVSRLNVTTSIRACYHYVADYSDRVWSAVQLSRQGNTRDQLLDKTMTCAFHTHGFSPFRRSDPEVMETFSTDQVDQYLCERSCLVRNQSNAITYCPWVHASS